MDTNGFSASGASAWNRSLPTAHGFDAFYGIPPNLSWIFATYVDTIVLTHANDELEGAILQAPD